MTPLIEDKAEKSEKVFLSYKKDFFNKKSSDDIKDDDTLILMKAAKLCRNENFLSSEPMFQGTTCEGLEPYLTSLYLHHKSYFYCFLGQSEPSYDFRS